MRRQKKISEEGLNFTNEKFFREEFIILYVRPFLRNPIIFVYKKCSGIPGDPDRGRQRKFWKFSPFFATKKIDHFRAFFFIKKP